MRYYSQQCGRQRTDKIWIDGPAYYVMLSQKPKPDSIEAWLNGERMTDIKRSDLDGLALTLGPLRQQDTLIITYETA